MRRPFFDVNSEVDFRTEKLPKEKERERERERERGGGRGDGK